DATSGDSTQGIYCGTHASSPHRIEIDNHSNRLLMVNSQTGGGTQRLFEYSKTADNGGNGTGVLLRSTRLDDTLTNASGVRRDPLTNDLLVSDPTARKVFRLGPQFGDHFGLAGLPSTPNNTQGVVRDPSGDLWIVDRGVSRAYRITTTGTHV